MGRMAQCARAMNAIVRPMAARLRLTVPCLCRTEQAGHRGALDEQSRKEPSMGLRRSVILAAAVIALSAPVLLALAQHQHDPALHGQTGGGSQHALVTDPRVAVSFPADLHQHTLTNMRDHLLALQEIQEALAQSSFDRAAEVAERRLGMSSLTAHGAHEVAKYMPKGMQDAGTAMHRSASRFSVAALDAAVTNDVKPALSALAEVTANCVACHAGYRLK